MNTVDVLHLVPAFAQRIYGAGHWKACQALGLSFRDVQATTRTSAYESDDGRDLPAVNDFRGDAVVEYSRAPELVAEVKRRWPSARVHVRAHNPEAWQHLHRSGGIGRLATNPRSLYAVARLLERDSRCRRLCRTIMSISESDSRTYWSWLPGRARIIDVPYFSPWPALRPHVRPRLWADREWCVLSLPGARDVIGEASARGFYALARGLSPLLPEWTFRISPGVLDATRDPSTPDGIEMVRDLAEPWDLLCRTRAVAVLTPLGFGAKTTIVDALAAGCHVLVHPRLLPRLPALARERCIPIDPYAPRDVGGLAGLLTREPALHDVNTHLRTQAADGVRAALDRTDER